MADKKWKRTLTKTDTKRKIPILIRLRYDMITSAGAMSATSSMSITNGERTRVVFKMNGILSATDNDSVRGETFFLH